MPSKLSMLSTLRISSSTPKAPGYDDPTSAGTEFSFERPNLAPEGQVAGH
jgi:hypothetical protein